MHFITLQTGRCYGEGQIILHLCGIHSAPPAPVGNCIFYITNLIPYRQLRHGSNKVVQSWHRGEKKKALIQTDPNQHDQKKKLGDVGKYPKTPRGKLSPKKIWDNLQGNRICVSEKAASVA